MWDDAGIHKDVETLSILLAQKGWKAAFAESCTGGLLAASITERPGSSSIFDRGFVTYSNDAKMECLGVSADTLDNFGAVSAETALEMASGTLDHSLADIALSVTGIAGPDGGSVDKPVGLVYFGIAMHKDNTENTTTVTSQHQIFSGTRTQIRQKAVSFALKTLIEHICAVE